MKTQTVYLTVRVDYTCPREMELEDSIGYATNLAIKSNYCSVVEGVSLEDVQVCGVEW